MLDVIERVTGLDLDGDGTVAGDIVCEVSRVDSAAAVGASKGRRTGAAGR